MFHYLIIYARGQQEKKKKKEEHAKTQGSKAITPEILPHLKRHFSRKAIIPGTTKFSVPNGLVLDSFLIYCLMLRSFFLTIQTASLTKGRDQVCSLNKK